MELVSDSLFSSAVVVLLPTERVDLAHLKTQLHSSGFTVLRQHFFNLNVTTAFHWAARSARQCPAGTFSASTPVAALLVSAASTRDVLYSVGSQSPGRKQNLSAMFQQVRSLPHGATAVSSLADGSLRPIYASVSNQDAAEDRAALFARSVSRPVRSGAAHSTSAVDVAIDPVDLPLPVQVALPPLPIRRPVSRKYDTASALETAASPEPSTGAVAGLWASMLHRSVPPPLPTRPASSRSDLASRPLASPTASPAFSTFAQPDFSPLSIVGRHTHSDLPLHSFELDSSSSSSPAAAAASSYHKSSLTTYSSTKSVKPAPAGDEIRERCGDGATSGSCMAALVTLLCCMSRWPLVAKSAVIVAAICIIIVVPVAVHFSNTASAGSGASVVPPAEFSSSTGTGSLPVDGSSSGSSSGSSVSGLFTSADLLASSSSASSSSSSSSSNSFSSSSSSASSSSSFFSRGSSSSSQFSSSSSISSSSVAPAPSLPLGYPLPSHHWSFANNGSSSVSGDSAASLWHVNQNATCTPYWTSELSLAAPSAAGGSVTGNGLVYPCQGVGSSSLLSSASFATSSFTWAGWAQISATSTSPLLQPLSTNSSTSGLLSLVLMPNADFSQTYLNIYMQGRHVVGNELLYFRPSTNWQLYSLTYDAVLDVVAFSVNGTLHHSASAGLSGGTAVSWRSGSADFFLSWYGVVRDVYMWDAVLTSQNLTSLYQAGLAPLVWTAPVFVPLTVNVDHSLFVDIASNSHFTSSSALTQSSTQLDTSPPSQPWVMNGVSELYCYEMEMTHQPAQQGGVQWSLKMGSAGQLYSLTLNSVELMGPVLQTNYPYGVWMDAVHQVVPTSNPSVNSLLPFSGASFIQAGQYPNTAHTVPYFAPSFQQHYDADAREFRMMSWMPQAGIMYGVDWQQLGDGQALRADHLLQSVVRDAGDVDGQSAVVELSYTSTNYGKWVLDNMNQDWAPLLYASLPYRWMSSPDGSFTQVDNTGLFESVDPASTNGWVMWSSTNDSQQLGSVVAYVYGSSPLNTVGLSSTDWVQVGVEDVPYAGGFNLLSTVYGLGNPTNMLQPGQSSLHRTYFVLGSNITQCAATANSISASLFTWGRPQWQGASTLPQNCSILASFGFGQQCAQVYPLSAPVNMLGMQPLPLYILQSTLTGAVTVTTSAYYWGAYNTRQQTGPTTQNTTAFLGLLGWGLATLGNTPPYSNMQRLSSLLPRALFNDVDRLGVDVWVSAQRSVGSYNANSNHSTQLFSYVLPASPLSCFATCNGSGATVSGCAAVGGNLGCGAGHQFGCSTAYLGLPECVPIGSVFRFTLTTNATSASGATTQSSGSLINSLSLHDSSSDYTFVLQNYSGQFSVLADPLARRGVVLHRVYRCCHSEDDMDVIQVTHPDLGKFPTVLYNNNYTFSAWVQMDASVALGALFSSCYSSQGMYISVQQSGVTISAAEVWGAPSPGYYAQTANTQLSLNQWYHIAVTYQGFPTTTHQYAVYINGQPVQMSYGATSQHGQAYNYGVCIGSWQYLSSPTGFRGYMDQLSLTNTIMTAAHIMDMYNSTYM